MDEKTIYEMRARAAEAREAAGMKPPTIISRDAAIYAAERFAECIKALAHDVLLLLDESVLQMTTPFSPLHEIETRSQPTASSVPSVSQLVAQMTELAKNGVGLGSVAPDQLVKLAAAIVALNTPTGPSSGAVTLDGIPGAYIESVGRTEVFKTDMSLERVGDMVKQHVRWQRWESET